MLYDKNDKQKTLKHFYSYYYRDTDVDRNLLNYKNALYLYRKRIELANICLGCWTKLRKYDRDIFTCFLLSLGCIPSKDRYPVPLDAVLSCIALLWPWHDSCCLLHYLRTTTLYLLSWNCQIFTTTWILLLVTIRVVNCLCPTKAVLAM